MRLYLGGQLSDSIGVTFNTERTPDGMEVIDAIARFEPDERFNVWAGRLLPPSDRSNLSGPFFLNAWAFPGLVQRYPNTTNGRDDGIAVWGQTGGGTFKYQLGAFEGTQGGPNQKDRPMVSGKLVYNFWDPEPGYYNASTYYGARDILAVGIVGMHQEDAAGTAGASGDFTGGNVELLVEKVLPNTGVATFETAFYSYDTDDLAHPNGSTVDGDGYFVLGSYLLPALSDDAPGRFQPMVRYQDFSPSNGADADRLVVGLNYVIDGHNARLSALYADNDGTDVVLFGAQLQL